MAMKQPDQIPVNAYRRITKAGAIQRVRPYVRKVAPYQRR
jgi:hypothetical protein